MDPYVLKKLIESYNFKPLPVLSGDYFIHRPVYNFMNWSTKFEDVVAVGNEQMDISVYGWAIEVSYDDELTWQNATKKIYQSKEDAMHAILQIKRFYPSSYRYKIKPLYEFDQATWRRHIILKILENEKSQIVSR